MINLEAHTDTCSKKDWQIVFNRLLAQTEMMSKYFLKLATSKYL